MDNCKQTDFSSFIVLCTVCISHSAKVLIIWSHFQEDEYRFIHPVPVKMIHHAVHLASQNMNWPFFALLTVLPLFLYFSSLLQMHSKLLRGL